MAEKKGASEKLLYCSFCGKSQHEVKKLIAGPSVFICDECIDLCNEIIDEEFVKNVDTGIARDTLTNENGNYFFPLVNPGRYEASVEKTGFKKSIQEVTVRTGIRSTADFSLQLG